jgi:hypothetical protein
MIRVKEGAAAEDDADECESTTSSGVRQASFQEVLREAMDKDTDITIYSTVRCPLL